MADRSNIDRLIKTIPPTQSINEPSSSELAQSAAPVVIVSPNQKTTKAEMTPEMIEFAKEQVYQKLKSSKKPISQMTDTEKIIFAEKEQKMIEDYEMFMNGVVAYDTMEKYSGKGDVFFSPVASIVLDEFFTDGQH